METVTVRRQYTVCLAELWKLASHPSQLSSEVNMLRQFRAPKKISEGSKLAEEHTILGWPQWYRGAITAYQWESHWSMTSSPVGAGPFPLPHDVRYAFSSIDEERSELSVACSYSRGGLLALPFVSGLVRWYMARTIDRLLLTVEQEVARCTV